MLYNLIHKSLDHQIVKKLMNEYWDITRCDYHCYHGIWNITATCGNFKFDGMDSRSMTFKGKPVNSNYIRKKIWKHVIRIGKIQNSINDKISKENQLKSMLDDLTQ